MEVTSVNIGKREHLAGRSFNGETGIFKRPVEGAVRVGKLGLESDSIVNEKHHGGEDQAVYLYRAEDYDWWSGRLGREVGPGSFGENLTIAGLATPGLPIGTRMCFADLMLEVTSPRIPCNTLATRMGDPAFIKAFVAAERPGLYCRVIETGTICAGQTFTLDHVNVADLSTIDLFRACYRKLTPDELKAFLATPIDIRTRRDFQRKLGSE